MEVDATSLGQQARFVKHHLQVCSKCEK